MDTVMQPQIASFVDGSDEEPIVPLKTSPLMTEDDWGDFSLDEEFRPCSMDGISSRMCTSLYEERPRAIPTRSISQPPRRRFRPRQQSSSPHRVLSFLILFFFQQQRLAKILSAVSVLMDELDPEGLRDVIDEAQRRIKKER